MTHDERRLLCLVGRLVAETLDQYRPMVAIELRKKIAMVQRDAAKKHAENARKLVRA